MIAAYVNPKKGWGVNMKKYIKNMVKNMIFLFTPQDTTMPVSSRDIWMRQNDFSIKGFVKFIFWSAVSLAASFLISGL